MLLKRIEEYDHIYIACGYTDMRKGIDGLVSIIEHQHKHDPFSNSIFLFCGRRRKFFKALTWEGNGFSLYYRRFDGQGASLCWPMKESEMECISIAQLNALLTGFAVFPKEGFEQIKNPVYS